MISEKRGLAGLILVLILILLILKKQLCIGQIILGCSIDRV